MADRLQAAFYAHRGGGVADWWSLLHPPYTLWHLSYVAIGAALVTTVDWGALGLSLLAFFLAVGLAAHALDELRGRPLGTSIPSRALALVAGLALAGAVALGVVGVFFWDGTNLALLLAIPVGLLVVLGYNLELFGGRLHTDAAFAWGWGGFPVAVGYVAQSPPFRPALLAAAVAATLAGVGTSYAQRTLSTPARRLRRRTSDLSGQLTSTDGTVMPLDRTFLLGPLETALKVLSWAIPLFAAAALLARV